MLSCGSAGECDNLFYVSADIGSVSLDGAGVCMAAVEGISSELDRVLGACALAPNYIARRICYHASGTIMVAVARGIGWQSTACFPTPTATGTRPSSAMPTSSARAC